MFLYKQIHLIEKKELRNAIQKIYGIGWYKSLLVSAKIGLSYPYCIDSLNIYNFYMLSCVLDNYSWLRTRINREIINRINMLISIGCHRGVRHKDKLPSRGQRTRTNARTRRSWKLRLN